MTLPRKGYPQDARHKDPSTLPRPARRCYKPVGPNLCDDTESEDVVFSDEPSSVHTCQDMGDYDVQSGTFNAGGVFQLNIYSDGSCIYLIESFGGDVKGNFEPSNGGFMDGFTVVLGDGA